MNLRMSPEERCQHKKEPWYEASATLGNQQLSPEEMIEWYDIHWTALTAEAGGVDYIEVDANGVLAMWIIPKGCVENRVIAYIRAVLR